MGVCDNCDRDTSEITGELRGTYGGPNEWWSYLCMGCWRRYIRSELGEGPAGTNQETEGQ